MNSKSVVLELLAAGLLAALLVVTSPAQVTIAGQVNLRARAGSDLGAVESGFPLNDLVLTLKPSDAQQAELTALLAAQQDPTSPDFHNWITPAQFADRFGPAQSDLDQITAWLAAEGFTIQDVAPSRNTIAFSGAAASAQHAFGVEIHRYTIAGQSHFAPVSEPHVPAAITGLIAGVRGLDDFLPQAPRANLHAAYTASSGGHYLAPGDAATIYNITSLYANGYDGTGQTLAIVGQSAVNLSDIDNFRSIFGLAKNDPKLVAVPNLTVPGIVAGDVIESDLDLEWAGAIAKNASLIFVYSSNVFNSLQYAVTQNLAPVISISYGTCETGQSAAGAALRAIAQQANAQGITLLSSSGDSGAFSCDGSSESSASNGAAVSLPASIPEVTAVGGTGFNEGSGNYWSASNSASDGSALSYIPEAVWNESAAGGLGASGGGASALFTKPVWQAGPGVPADGARDVPDIAMAAGADHDGAIICISGGCANGLLGGKGATGASIVGGTSLAAPVFAGITALLNQYEVKTGALSKAGLGNINPTLYPLAQNYGGVFHDITVGNNVVPCHAGSSGCATGSFGYQAGPGYDQATGLGSVNAYSLVTDWSLIKSAPAALSSLVVSPSSVAPGATVTITVSLTAAAPAAGVAVTLTGGASAFPLPARISVPAGQSSASVNVVAGTVTASTPVTVTGTYDGAVKTATVTIAPVVAITLTSVSVSPASVAAGASATLTVTLSSAAPTGGATVALTGTSAAFPVPASVVVLAGQKTISLTVNASTVAASTSATITAKYNGGTETTSVTITPVVLPTLSSLAFSQASVTGGANATLTIALSAPVPSGSATIALSSSTKAFPVPASIVIPAGYTGANVVFQTLAVTVSTPVTITATYGGVTKTASITLTPGIAPTAAAVTLTALSVSPSIKGGTTANLTITLSGPAPAAGTIITLGSTNSAIPLPPSVEMPPSGVSGTLTVQTKAVTASTTGTITVTAGGVTKTATVTITP
jgi:hypothetical protein